MSEAISGLDFGIGDIGFGMGDMNFGMEPDKSTSADTMADASAGGALPDEPDAAAAHDYESDASSIFADEDTVAGEPTLLSGMRDLTSLVSVSKAAEVEAPAWPSLPILSTAATTQVDAVEATEAHAHEARAAGPPAACRVAGRQQRQPLRLGLLQSLLRRQRRWRWRR